MHPVKTLIQLADAQKLLSEVVKPIQTTEKVMLLELLGRVAAQDIKATFNVPPFRRAGMDGYALKSTAIAKASEKTPVTLRCIDKIHAGEISTQQVSETTCIEIATGAMVPDSADVVVQVEFTRGKNDQIEFLKALPVGQNISPAGIDLQKGHIILKEGEIFTPAKIGVLAALNIDFAVVYQKPKIAIIPTGKEIAKIGSKAGPAQIYDINSYTISAMITEFGGEPMLWDIVPDEPGSLENAFLDASKKADMVLIIGGSSAGESDYNADILAKYGKILFHGIQIKPGKPTIGAILNEKLVINLPGFPTSCLTNGYVMIRPLLCKIAHISYINKTVKGKLSQRIMPAKDRDQLLMVRIDEGIVYSTFKESGAITSISQSHGYIIVPHTIPYLEKDSEVEVVMF